jgi:1-acyl-sn-glycerol-3-phosphate acyltransferase
VDPKTRRLVRSRIDRLEIPFNRDGIDPYGISKKHLGHFLSMVAWFYRHYFRARVYGVGNIPARGRAMLVGNHSGGFAIDGGMVIAAAFLELDPPRLAQGMADKFIARMPFASQWTSRTGQFTGLPEHAVRLLEDERLLMVFPEGHAGTAKLFHERYSLVRFGTGFVRLALATDTPIIPFAFLGGGEAVPTVANLYQLGRLVGAPYLPVTPYLLPIPLPVPVSIHFGEPLRFEGTGTEDDAVVFSMIGEVKERIGALIDQGREA